MAATGFLLAATSLPGETTSGLKGRIIYKLDRAPIRNVDILAHRSGGADEHVRTDDSGQYSIHLPPGIYDIFISAEGYAPTCRKIEIEPYEMKVFNATLEFTDVGKQH